MKSRRKSESGDAKDRVVTPANEANEVWSQPCSCRARKIPKGIQKRGESFYTRRRVDGHIRWIHLGTDLDEAKKRYHELEAGVRAPVPVVATPVSIEGACADWLASYIATTRNPKGQHLAAVRAKKYVLVFFAGKTLAELTGDDVRDYRLWLEGQKASQGEVLSPSTVTHLLSDLRAFLNWCKDSQRIERSPFPRRVMPRVQETLPKTLSTEEVAKLISLPDPVGFYLRFFLGTGLRWAEGCRAQASDVKGSLLQVANTKSGRVRRVPLPAGLLAEVRSRVGRLIPYSPESTGSFNRMVRRSTGITGFHVHRCRHTFATQWLTAGGNLAVLQEVLGHRDLSTTARYAKVTEELVQSEAARVQERQKGA